MRGGFKKSWTLWIQTVRLSFNEERLFAAHTPLSWNKAGGDLLHSNWANHANINICSSSLERKEAGLDVERALHHGRTKWRHYASSVLHKLLSSPLKSLIFSALKLHLVSLRVGGNPELPRVSVPNAVCQKIGRIKRRLSTQRIIFPFQSSASSSTEKSWIMSDAEKTTETKSQTTCDACDVGFIRRNCFLAVLKTCAVTHADLWSVFTPLCRISSPLVFT